MATFKVRNGRGDTFDVDEAKIGEAEKDGFLPVVSNGKEEHRVAHADLSSAMKDGFKPLSSAQEASSIPEAMLRGAADYGTFGFSDEIEGGAKAIKDAVVGSEAGLVDNYKKHRDEARQANKLAADEHPVAYHGAGIGTSVATGGLVGKALGTGLQGAVRGGMIQGLGASEAEDTMGMARDVATGGALGGAIHGVAAGASKALGAAGKKTGNAVFGVPEGATERYLARPDAVNTAKGFKGVTDSFLDDVGQKRADLGSGSAEGFDILKRSGKSLPAGTFTQPIKNEITRLTEQGAFTRESKQTLSKLGELVENIEGAAQGLDGRLSLDKGKALVMQLDDLISRARATNAGNQELKSLVTTRQYIDETLKIVSPEYKDHMAKLATDTETVKDIADKFRSENGAQNLLKRVTRGKDEYAGDALKAYDERFGGTFSDDLQDSFAKDAFSRDTTNGSRKALKGYAVGQALGGAAGGMVAGPTGIAVGGMMGGAAGALTGGALDKYGTQIWKGVLDGTLKVGPYAKILEKAAQNGPAQVALTHYLLMKNHPEYAKSVQESENP